MDSLPSESSLPCCEHIHRRIPCDSQHRSVRFVRLWHRRLSVARPSSIGCPASIRSCRVWTWSTLPSCCGLHHCGRLRRLPVCVILPLRIRDGCDMSHICFGWCDTSSSLRLLHVAASPPRLWFLRLLCSPAHGMGVHSAIVRPARSSCPAPIHVPQILAGD